MIILSNNNQIEFTIKTIYSCHCLDYRDTILALKDWNLLAPDIVELDTPEAFKARIVSL
jgi:hypothetical protein